MNIGTDSIVERIRGQVASGALRLTMHAVGEMTAEGILLDDVLDAIGSGEILENYPNHRRGPCCLLWGATRTGTNVHVVCTTAQETLIVITVYKPVPPKFPAPGERSIG